ncbi:unnamed protein product, partial [Pylaiella littoralis]
SPKTPIISWAELDPGEEREDVFDKLGHRVVVENSSDEEGGRGEDEDGAPDEESTEIAALRRRRAYIIAQLHNVGQSIRETEAEVLVGQCLPEIPKRDLAPKDTVDESQTGSFLHAVDWRTGSDDGPGPKPLTDRAAERAGALLTLFDNDGDGCLSFDEFRAYLIRLGRDKGKLGERLTTNREFWLNYAMDQAGPAPASDIGGTVSFDGMSLTQSGFIGHRRMVERERPLELDLLAMGLDLLPECLQRWLKAKDAFDRIDAEGVSSAAARGESGDRTQEGCDGSIERGEAQLLLADAGEVMSKLRVEEELGLATMRAKLLLQLVEERRRRNRLANTQEFSRAAAFDSKRVYRSAWLSWFLSGRAKEEAETSWLEKGLIRMKMGLYRGFRTFCGMVGYPRRALESLAQQGLISSNLLASCKGSDARATVRMAVGDAVDDGRGFSVSLNFLHKGNASTEYPVDKLPPGVGLSATLDLEGKYETTELAFETVAAAVEKVVRAHALPELKRSVLFHSMRVTAVNLPDKTQVLRIAILWRAQASIDFQCRQLKLGLRVTDLVRELTVSFFCPLQLSQILESSRTILNDRLKVSLSAEGCFCGPLISRLMEETLAGMIGSAQQAAADSVEHDLDRVKRQARTQANAPGMPHPLVAPKRKIPGIVSGVGGGSSRACGGKNAPASSASSSGVKAAAAATASATSTSGRLRTDREKRFENSKAKRWLDRMWAFAAKLRGTKAFSLDLEAGSPLEFLDSSLARAYLPASWRSEEVFTTPGYAAAWFAAWKRSFLTQASSLGERAREHLQNRLRQEAAQEKAAAAADTDEGGRLAGLEAELARLGVSKALLAETMGEKEEETARRLRETKDEQMEEHADLEDALRACTKYLLGPRELRVQSGQNVLAVEMQGLDIFDALSTSTHGGGQDEDGGSRDSGSVCSSTSTMEE